MLIFVQRAPNRSSCGQTSVYISTVCQALITMFLREFTKWSPIVEIVVVLTVLQCAHKRVFCGLVVKALDIIVKGRGSSPTNCFSRSLLESLSPTLIYFELLVVSVKFCPSGKVNEYSRYKTEPHP